MAMNTDLDFEIFHLSHGPDAIAHQLESYKALRLLSLQESAQFFGSTFSRESQFTESEWMARFTNPAANTFLASKDGQILGSVTVMGPLPYDATVYNPTRIPWGSLVMKTPDDLVAVASKPFHFGINGVFVLPAARGRGIATTVMSHALAFALKRAQDYSEEVCVASVVVDSDNPNAISLYKKAGFQFINAIELQPRADGSIRSGQFMRVKLRADSNSTPNKSA